MLIDHWGCVHIVRRSPDWCRAMQHSIRPAQMRNVAVRLRRQVRPWSNVGSSDVAAWWLRQQFESGRLDTDEDRPIKPAFDTVCPPCTTWRRAVGDCDDYTAMMTSLIRQMGSHADFVAGQVL
ncbi:MAG: hypothetical protein KDK70_17155, partial [Myxococcales bacterium]|nr:hypothetical protein [Myxococcales bacterium]